MKKDTFADETLGYICEMLDKTIDGEINNYGITNNIEKAVMQHGDNDINDLLEKIKRECNKFWGPFIIPCQSGKMIFTQGMTHEDRNRCRAICS